jgi:hypothetical protein
VKVVNTIVTSSLPFYNSSLDSTHERKSRSIAAGRWNQSGWDRSNGTAGSSELSWVIARPRLRLTTEWVWVRQMAKFVSPILFCFWSSARLQGNVQVVGSLEDWSKQGRRQCGHAWLLGSIRSEEIDLPKLCNQNNVDEVTKIDRQMELGDR